MEIVFLKNITNNHDNLRKPLNQQERDEKTIHGLYPYVGANNIQGYIDEYIFDEKILCISEDGGSWGANQVCSKIYNEKCWVNNHAHVLTAHNSKVILEYLMHYLNFKDLNSFITGTTRGKLTKAKLESIPIPLPPLEQQKKIAEKLDKADALRKKDQELLAQYDELAQAIFIDMFGDPVQNEKGWEMVNFEEVLKLKRGYDLPVQDRNTKGTIPVYGSNGVLDYHDEFKTIKPCLITGRSGTIGKVHISEEFCWPLNTTLYSYETYDNNIFFLHYLLVNLKIERFAHGAGVPTLDRKIVHKEMIPNINKELQNQFAEKIKNIEAQKTIVKQQAEESENLFQALLQESFNF